MGFRRTDAACNTQPSPVWMDSAKSRGAFIACACQNGQQPARQTRRLKFMPSAGREREFLPTYALAPTSQPEVPKRAIIAI